MGWSGSTQVPAGFRDSDEPAVERNEVVGGCYAIREQVARTDTGVVFEARDMMLDRLVAVKLAWRDPGMPSLILEARRCAAVRDPCAVAIHGMGSHRGVEFVVGERVLGRLLTTALAEPPEPAEHLAKLRTLVAAVARAHEAGIAVGDISGTTVLIDRDGRMVLGRLSLSQVPAFGPLGRILAPEVVRGDAHSADPAAAEAIDLYGLGCVAIEMALGAPPFANTDSAEQLRRHAEDAPPHLASLRPDLPAELSDLVDWLLAKQPSGRPPGARDVLAQLDAIIDRMGAVNRAMRVLVVDDDAGRARWLWSLARRAHPHVQVEVASEGTEAAHKLQRDLPDLVFVDAALRGVMNAFEVCMYARGLETEHAPQLVLIGELAERDRALFAGVDVASLVEDRGLGHAVIERVRSLARQPPRRRRARSTVSG